MKLRTFIGFPFTVLFGGITALRNLFYDIGYFKSSEFDLPVINVGNLRVGGSGKSPHIEYLISLLKDEHKLAVLSRGYGRKTKGFKEVLLEDKAKDSGDEPLQFKTRFPDVNVFVGENRVDAVIDIMSKHGDTNAILLDDAYQHRGIKPGFNILVSDYKHLFTRDYVMPAGDLRERRKGAKRANAVIISKCPFDLAEQEKEEIKKSVSKYTSAEVFFSAIDYGSLFDLESSQEIDLKEQRILFVSGIANAKPAVNYLELQFPHVDHLEFRDHYLYTESDIEKIIQHAKAFRLEHIITTYKDAMRLKALWNDDYPKLLVLPIQIVFLANDKENFDQKIKFYVEGN